MDIKKILKYQETESKLLELEKKISNNPSRLAVNKSVEQIKKAQTYTNQLEENSKQSIDKYKDLSKVIEENFATLESIKNISIESANNQDLEKWNQTLKNLAVNFDILEKKLMQEADKTNKLLANFESTKKTIKTNNEKYALNKTKYEEYLESQKPKLNKLKQDMENLEKEISPEIIAIYKQRRQDRIFPVFVPTTENMCSGCMMELPSALLDKLNSKGYLECENCRRIIYLK